MEFLSSITFDQIAFSLMTLGLLREAMIVTLPDAIAGPGGWLVDTDPKN